MPITKSRETLSFGIGGYHVEYFGGPGIVLLMVEILHRPFYRCQYYTTITPILLLLWGLYKVMQDFYHEEFGGLGIIVMARVWMIFRVDPSLLGNYQS